MKSSLCNHFCVMGRVTVDSGGAAVGASSQVHQPSGFRRDYWTSLDPGYAGSSGKIAQQLLNNTIGAPNSLARFFLNFLRTNQAREECRPVSPGSMAHPSKR